LRCLKTELRSCNLGRAFAFKENSPPVVLNSGESNTYEQIFCYHPERDDSGWVCRGLRFLYSLADCILGQSCIEVCFNRGGGLSGLED